MSDVTFEKVWKALPDATAEALVRFWVDRKAILSEEAARKRAPQAVFVARERGELVGVSTAFRQFNAQLNHYFWYVRAFVAEPQRRQRVAWDLWVQVRDALEADFVSGADTDCIGIVLEVESPVLQQIDRAVWTTGPVFFGKNARGAHLRVYYFEGARIR
jgi:hypothetical protein